MTANKLDTLPAELLSYICEFIYTSHKPSLAPLTLVNKRCESAASSWLFHDVYFTYRPDDEVCVHQNCDRWDALLTRRGCLKSVRLLHVRGAFWLHAPSRCVCSRQTVLAEAEWQKDALDEFGVHEQPTLGWEDSSFHVLAKLIEKLSFLERLQWAAIERVPDCVLKTISELRPDLRFEIPEWRLRLARRHTFILDQTLLIDCAHLRSVTARIMQGDTNRDALLCMLRGHTPSLEEIHIIQCDTLTCLDFDSDPFQASRYVGLHDICELNEQKAKARLTLFSLYGKEPVDTAELKQWFDAADMSSLRCLRLRSGVKSAEVWKSTLQAESLPHLQELLLGFPCDSTSAQHDAVAEWLQLSSKVSRDTLHMIELQGSIPRTLVTVVIKTHGKTLRKLALRPQAHSGIDFLNFTTWELDAINSSCPSLQELIIPLQRARISFDVCNEADNYAVLSQFPNLSHLHILLDCSRWGQVRGWMLHSSGDTDFDEQTYVTLDDRRITYNHVRFALVNSAVDETLARGIWEHVAKRKVGVPLHELYIQPYGSMEIIRGFRPDDRPDLAGRLTDLYAILREIGRPYKISRHVRDDVDGLVVREPPGAIPRGYWSKVGEKERELGEVVCHLKGVEMEIFRRIWPEGSREGSRCWRDDWCSLELPVLEERRV